MAKPKSKSPGPAAPSTHAPLTDRPAVTEDATCPDRLPRRWLRIAVLLAGILIPQIVLIGPSLVGAKLLLPLDILADRTTYLPRADPTAPNQVPKDGTLGDLVFQTEVHRQLVIEEIHAGRVPLWNPYNYCGHPLLAANHTQVFSPYRVLDYLWPSPVVLAWGHLLRAVVIGVGTYLLLTRSMGLHWLAAAIGGWLAPIAGPMILASGYPGASIISFLPWMLLAVDRCVVRPDGKSVAAVAVVTAASLLAGHPAFAGHLLLVAGLFYLYRHLARFGLRNAVGKPAAPSAVAAVVGVLLGFLLSGPQTLPTVEYMKSSQRITKREQGIAEDKGIGSAAFVQMVLPYALGSTQRGSLYIGVEGNRLGNRIESAAIGATGVVAALLLLPLGWADRRRRGAMVFWSLLALFCAVPVIGVPVIGAIFELPPFSLLRNNRLVFASGFAVVVMAAIGLNALIDHRSFTAVVAGRVAMAVGLLLSVLLAGWCADKAFDIALAEADEPSVAADPLVTMIPDRWPGAVNEDVIGWFGLMYRNGIMLAAVTALLAAVVLYSTRTAAVRSRQTLAFPVLLALLAVAELIASAYGVNVQTDPSLYYPRLGWMDQVNASHDRMCGVGCLPANVGLSHRLRDIRGYDGADPMPVVSLIDLAQDKTQPPILALKYAITLYLNVNPHSPGPVANLLSVRHLVGRGPPPPGLKLTWARDDYWVAENSQALPRATLPARIEVVPDPAERLARLSSASADPASVTLLEAERAGVTPAAGTVLIAEEHAGRVVLDVDLTRGGLVRLADSWDAGWRATYNGQDVEILRVDHALRGVVVPAGKGQIEFLYAPRSFTRGLWLAALAAVATMVVAGAWRNRDALSPAAAGPVTVPVAS